MTIRQKQAKIWEELLILETQVSCKFLPKTFNDLETFIALNMYSPVIHDQTAILFKNQHHKIIQEVKRSCLNIAFNTYEIQLQEYEQQ